MDDLTFNQEIFVALAASEQIKFQARLAGAKIDDKPRHRKFGKDEYGELLERRARMKRMDDEFLRNREKFVNKPL
jgi:hypothetical protein